MVWGIVFYIFNSVLNSPPLSADDFKCFLNLNSRDRIERNSSKSKICFFVKFFGCFFLLCSPTYFLFFSFFFFFVDHINLDFPSDQLY